MGKNDTFLIFGEWEDNCEELTDEEFGQMMRAVFAYCRRGENPTFSDRFMRACWRPIQQAIDRANNAYEAKCEQNRENGKKGGRPKKEETEKPNGFLEDEKKPNGYFGFSKKTEKTLPNPYPYPNLNRDPNPTAGSPSATKTKSKNKFKNFEERVYPDEVYEKLLGGGQA